MSWAIKSVLFPHSTLRKLGHRPWACVHILASGRLHSFNENLLILCFVLGTVLGYMGYKSDPVHALTYVYNLQGDKYTRIESQWNKCWARSIGCHVSS